MRNAKLIARLMHQKLIPDDADLLAWDEALGQVPAKSVITLSKDEKKAAEDEAMEAKRAEQGQDAAELSDEEREAAWEKARDKKRAKDKARDESEEEAEDEESEEKAEDSEEEEAKDEESEKEAEDEESEEKAEDADPDHRKDFRDLQSSGPPKGDKRAKDGARDQGRDHAQDSRQSRRTRRVTEVMAQDEMAELLKTTQQRAAKQAREEMRKEQRALMVAIEEVAPLVGRVQPHAFDNAQEVYEFALNKSGYDLSSTPKSAYRTAVQIEARHAKRIRSEGSAAYAHDSTLQEDEYIDLGPIFMNKAD